MYTIQIAAAPFQTLPDGVGDCILGPDDDDATDTDTWDMPVRFRPRQHASGGLWIMIEQRDQPTLPILGQGFLGLDLSAGTTIEDGAHVARSVLWEGVTVGANAKIGANSFIGMRDVPSDCTAAGSPARLVKRGGQRVDEALPRTELSPQSVPLASP